MAVIASIKPARLQIRSTNTACAVIRTPRSALRHTTRSSAAGSTGASDGAELPEPSPTTAPPSIDEDPSTSGRGKLIGTVITTLGLVTLIGAGVLFQDAIKDFLVYFSGVVDDWGALGVLMYIGVYTGLEVLALPAIPLTMSAGAIFGIAPGSLIVSFAGTLAATISFLIARYVARDKVSVWARKNKQFRAIDKVIGENGLRVVTLLRLSPLLPLSASNYLYGLTSVSLGDYFIGSWVGMLPGTIAYVSAGHVSKVAFMEGGELPLEWWQVALAFAVSAVAIGYIGNLAKEALANMDDDLETTQHGE